LETEYLRTLIETVSKGSVSGAAERVFVTPSAVSRRIKFLEDLFGCPLLDRSGPTLKPTEAGRLVLEKATEILTIERELMKGLRGTGERMCLSFCCSPAFGISYLPGILKDILLAGAKPENLNILFGTPDDIVRRLTDHLVDVAVLERCGISDLKDYEEYPLPEEKILFVSAPELGIESGTVRLDALTPFRIFVRSGRCCSRILLDGSLRRIGENLDGFGGIITCEDLQVIINAVANGGGIAFLSKGMVRGLLDDGILRAHNVDGFEHNVKRTLVVRKSFRPDMQCAVFLDAVFSAFNLDRPPMLSVGNQGA
jgi:DNA-binding transcriptional LysR family regulator